jgi:hypothetical protein
VKALTALVLGLALGLLAGYALRGAAELQRELKLKQELKSAVHELESIPDVRDALRRVEQLADKQKR